MAELGEEGFYLVLPTPPALLGGLELLAEALLLAKRLVGLAPTAQIESLIAAVESRVNATGQEVAVASERLIIDKINQTRVRPEADRGRKHLADGVRSESLGLGAVGIGSIPELDTVVGSDGKPFWRAQEWGSHHLVGRTIPGLFQPGNAPASQEQFRVHPIFEVGDGGAMTIRRPIPARHFMRDGSAEATLLRDRLFGETQTVAIAEIRAIRAVVAAL